MDIADGVTFLAFCEAVLRENDQNAEALDGLYAPGLSAGPPPPLSAAEVRAERNAQIQRAAALFGG